MIALIQRVVGKVTAAFIASVIAVLFASCGPMLAVGVGIGDGHDPFWDSGIYLYNGFWQGKYVWYNGDWHYRGYGTPYTYDPWQYNDPWNYYH